MNTLRNLPHALPFRRKAAVSGCGFLSLGEVEACLDRRLSGGRQADFEQHRRGGCAPCNLLASDIEVFRGVFESGPLPGEMRAFNDSQAIVKAHLRQELEKREARRGGFGAFGFSWKAIAGATAAVLLLTLIFIPRGGMEGGTIRLPGGGSYAVQPMPFSPPPMIRGADSLEASWQRAEIEYAAGDYLAAAGVFGAIRDEDPSSHEAALYRGISLVLAGRHAQAVEPLRAALQLGEDLDLRLAADHYFLGVAYLGIDDTAAAVVELEASRDAGGSYGELAAELLALLKPD